MWNSVKNTEFFHNKCNVRSRTNEFSPSVKLGLEFLVYFSLIIKKKQRENVKCNKNLLKIIHEIIIY